MAAAGKPAYPHVPAQADYPAIENEILARWDADKTFRRSVEARPSGTNGDNEYVFYDGPPFANGLPHYGHLLTGFVKDAVPRYQTMRGRRVERRFGWDCHGLPAEMEAEKQLGISGHIQINEYGVDKFNDFCRTSVMAYADEWERYVTRQARWVDFEGDYKTMDLPYMESVMWAFSTLYDKGLIYEGYRVVPYSWAAETVLSNMETRLDDSYRDRQDPALTVWFEATEPHNGKPLRFLAWTTTPWTLPSNLALAVGPDLTYAVLEENGVQYVIGESRMAAFEKELENATLVETVQGSAFVGRTYGPLFPFFADQSNAFRVLAGDFVTDDDGTGIVHIAPGFGEDDQKLCDINDIALVVPVDERGRFTSEVPPYQGKNVILEANPEVIKDLKAAGRVVRHETIVHSYPHCWRTDQPLIYKAVSSWFVEVTKFRDRLVELNQQIEWFPEHIRDGVFGKWLENARDWSISRNRFWGSPIPVWKSDDPTYPRVDVYGSIEDLQRDFGVDVADLHRPTIDDLTRPNPDDPTGKSVMRRVPEVLDCWFESGSMTFAQNHYPFENREWFENHFPADFIVEYVGQTRGWFYTMHVLSTALFDKPPFKRCVSHGIVLGEDGRKMSKKLRNYPDPIEMFETLGADAVRWFLFSSPVLRGLDIAAGRRAMEEAVRNALNPIWNVWYFFSLYANTNGVTAVVGDASSTDLLDRYVLAKCREMTETATAALDATDIPTACAAVESFLDALTNWYVRRSRDRFWDGDQAAANTLATVLDVTCRVVAPLLPMLSDTVWTGLTGGDSVHLADWPDATLLPADHELVADMDRVRVVCSAALSIRKATNRRVRLPLASLVVAGAEVDHLAPYRDVIADEVNVKSITFVDVLDGIGEKVLTVNPRELGPRLGSDVQRVIGAAKKGDYTVNADGTATAGGVDLLPGEFVLKLVANDVERARALPGDDALVVLDIDTTDELEAEGLARDVVRLVQVARREAELHVSDRIVVTIEAPTDVTAAVRTHSDWVAGEVLATSLLAVDAAGEVGGDGVHVGHLPDDRAVGIRLVKA